MSDDAMLTQTARSAASPVTSLLHGAPNMPAVAAEIAPIVGFDGMLDEAMTLLGDRRATEVVIENRTGAPLRIYGCHVAEGARETPLPAEIPAWSAEGQHAAAPPLRLKIAGRGAGASGVVVLTQEDPAEIGVTNVMMLFWRNPSGVQTDVEGARGVMLATGATPAWPLRDPATGAVYAPEDVCAALWAGRALDPATGLPSTHAWEKLTRPSPFGPARRVAAARWTGGGCGQAHVYLARSRVAAAEALGLIH